MMFVISVGFHVYCTDRVLSTSSIFHYQSKMQSFSFEYYVTAFYSVVIVCN